MRRSPSAPPEPALPHRDDAIPVERDDLGSRREPRAGEPRGPCELAAHGAHAADGNVPRPRSAADHVVEEAAVGEQRGVVVGGEGADERVGVDDAAHEVVGEGLGDRGADGALDEGIPQGVVADRRARLGAGQQRVGHRREQRAGEPPGARVEALPGLGVGGRAERGEARGRRLRVVVVDEQAAGSVRVRRVRAVAARGERDREPEIVDDLLRQQADQVRVAAEPGIHPRERLRRDRGPAQHVEPLEHLDVEARLREVGGRGEAVVAAADDDDVAPFGHGMLLLECGGRRRLESAYVGGAARREVRPPRG